MFNLEEHQYFNLIKEVLVNGESRHTRNSNTLTLFAPMPLRFNLQTYNMPLLTSKKISFHIVFHELMWFLKGSTNGKYLKDLNINIWRDNGSREYLDSIGLYDNKEDDLGPIYGFQWRHFGAKYIDAETTYTSGVDQIRYVIQEILYNPTSRRIILCAWNPCNLEEMALPPCHVLVQFYVRNLEFLDCQLYQRSADIGLGVPYNIASYSLLLHILSKLTGLKPGIFTHVMGDAHIYKSHAEPLKSQTNFTTCSFPKLTINLPQLNYLEQRSKVFVVDDTLKKLQELKLEDFIVSNYNTRNKIKLDFFYFYFMKNHNQKDKCNHPLVYL